MYRTTFLLVEVGSCPHETTGLGIGDQGYETHVPGVPALGSRIPYLLSLEGLRYRVSRMPRLVTSFDSVVLAAVAREITALVGSRVTRVAQPDPDEVALDLHGAPGTRTLVVSIHPRWARVHLTAKTAGGEPSAFSQMLRSRLEAARLAGVRHPPFERVLGLALDTVEGRTELIAEIMGRHSNLILVKDGVIAGSLKPVPRSKSSVREVMPGRPYLPPPQDRLSPLAFTRDSLETALSSGDEPLAKRLVASVLGLSPALATDLAVRAGLDPLTPARAQDDAAGRLWIAMQDVAAIVTAGAFAPVMYYDGDEPVGFAPFPLMHLTAFREVRAATMSAAVDTVLGRRGAAARIDEERATLLAAVHAALARVERTEREIQQAIQQAERTGRLRRHGELLLAYASQVPVGAAEVTLPGFDGLPETIELDPTLSPVQNAQRLFKRYGRVRSARPALDARLRTAAAERAYLESAVTLVEQATTVDDLFDLRRELVEEGYLRGRRARMRPSAAAGPRRFVLAGGATVLVGRTNRENDVLTFKLASPEDLWLHARGVPGAHVVLKTGRDHPGEDIVRQAAAIAAYFSRARGSGTVAVDYTKRKYVRKPKGGKPGLVTITQERTVNVKPDLPKTSE